MPRKKKRAEKARKAEKKKKRRSKVFPVVIVILLVALVVLVPVLLVQGGYVDNPFEDFNAEPQLFLIKDECSVIVGNLIHTMNDEDDCSLKCKNECGVREMEFYESHFIQREGDCHMCECYCI
ncbi:MAG: hypothetical protein ABIH92_04650 [Nanoarchaeota archaeon]